MSLIKIKYAISGSTPLLAENYITSANENPTELTVGEQVSLNFASDGVYFTLVPVKGQVQITNASVVSWICKAPFTASTLVINNLVDAEADVEITIPVKVKLAPQVITKPFFNQFSAPIDTRLVLSKREMIEINDAYQPEVYFALCKDDGHFYLYNKSTESSAETGKFRIITDIIKQDTPEIKIICGGNANYVVEEQ